MFANNNKITAFQFFILGCMIGNALFVGIGTTIIIFIAKQNNWIVALISIFLGIIPILVINKIMDYRPELTIFEKIKSLFSPILSHIINLIITLFIFLILLMSFWSLTNFASTKYLNETPLVFIGLLFIIPTIYACLKGIETITRTSEFLFYISLIMYFVITNSLLQYFDFENVKPILVDGIKPIIEGVFKFITYCATPFLALTIIPKSNIIDTKNFKKALIFGYIVAAIFMTVVFFMIMSIVGVKIASIYRIPEYYVIKKITITTAFDNVESFLSVHWIFNLFVNIMICFYFVTEYVYRVFKVNKAKTKRIITIIIGIIVIYVSGKIFVTTTHSNHFIYHYFSLYFVLPMFLLLIFIIYKIKKKEKSENKT